MQERRQLAAAFLMIPSSVTACGGATFPVNGEGFKALLYQASPFMGKLSAVRLQAVC